MTTISAHRVLKPTLNRTLLGSVVGGMIFGMLMQMMNMIKTVAMLVSSTSTGVGWLIHLVISMVFGIAFLIGLSAIPLRAPAAIIGLLYGVVLWVVGFLVIMPLKLHMSLFHFDSMAWKSLMGHMIYGLILAIIATRELDSVAK